MLEYKSFPYKQNSLTSNFAVTKLKNLHLCLQTRIYEDYVLENQL